MQLQYQLMRAFGRVLGLGWSQTNDNVFTGSPQATFNQAMHWPVMHPIDIICGPYTYQCMPQPFTLRPDDLSALAQLYYIGQGQAPPGKTDTLLNASQFSGRLFFSDGQGMQGVNVVGRRWAQFTDPSQVEDWDTVSVGLRHILSAVERQSRHRARHSRMAGSQGTSNNYYEGFFDLARVPMLPGSLATHHPGDRADQPVVYRTVCRRTIHASTVEPSGSNLSLVEGSSPAISRPFIDFYVSDSASTCNHRIGRNRSCSGRRGRDGLVAGTALRIWPLRLVFAECQRQPLTDVEVTAEDEQGFATTAKAMPVIGVWNATDARGSLPGVASAGEAFNGASHRDDHADHIDYATETVTNSDCRSARRWAAGLQLPGACSVCRFADPVDGERGRRHDHDYRHGLSHRQCGLRQWRGRHRLQLDGKHDCGHRAVAPHARYQHCSGGRCYGEDLSTGGTTVMTQALSYAAPVTTLSLLTAPSGTVILGQQATVPFAVQVLQGDGVTPVVGEAVTFTTTAGTVQFAACGAATCTLHTDANGIASTLVTPETSGAITLQATGVDGTASRLLHCDHPDSELQPRCSRWSMSQRARPSLGRRSSTSPTILLPPQVTLSIGGRSPAPLSASPGQSQVNTPGRRIDSCDGGCRLAHGAQALLSGCAWTSVCATFTTQGVDPAELRLVAVSGAGQIVSASGALTPVVLLVTDAASHPVAGAAVQIYQTVDAWQPPCPDRGRCPIPPVLASSQYSLISDANGLLTITPQQLVGIAETTNLAAATGTQGFLSLTLEKQP